MKQLGFLDPVPDTATPHGHAPAPRHPVVVERERLNAAALRVLEFLARHGEATNVELCDPSIGGMRAIGRVHELRRQGHHITKEHVTGGLWRYTYHGPRKR